MKKRDKDLILPIKIGDTHQFGNDKFVKIEEVIQNRFFHKIYIRIKDGKLYTNKIIKILNTNIFEVAGILFIKGRSIEKDLVNGHEII